MTFAPPTLTALAHLWASMEGTNLGIVGDSAHAATGTSYHLGKSQLKPGAYSAVLARDVKGLSEAASAIDLGQLHGSLRNLQRFSVWFVDAVVNHPTTYRDVREVIYSPDGIKVLRWDNNARRLYTGGDGTGQGDNTHLWHTHISWFRDSEFRAKTQLFEPYFTGATVPADKPEAPDMPGIKVQLDVTMDTNPYDALVAAHIKGTGHDLMDLATGIPTVQNVADGYGLGICALGTAVAPFGTWLKAGDRVVVYNHIGRAHLSPMRDVTTVPLARPPDTTPYSQSELTAAHATGYAEAKTKALAAVQTI